MRNAPFDCSGTQAHASASVFQQVARLKSHRLAHLSGRLERQLLTLAISRTGTANGAVTVRFAQNPKKTKSGKPPASSIVYPFSAATVSVAFSSMKPISLLQLRS